MTIPIELKSNRSVEYNIYIDKLPKLKFNRKVAIITNPTISKLHLNTLLKNIVADMVYVVTIPMRGSIKNLRIPVEDKF